MGNSVIITTIVILALITVPFVIRAQKKSKKTKHLLHQFHLAGSNQNLHLSEQDIWEHRGIGIDRNSECILFAMGTEFNDNVEKIELQKVRRSEVNKIMKSSGSISVVDRIELRIVFKDTNTPHLFLEFYNVQGGKMINEEFFLAEKWEKIINESL